MKSEYRLFIGVAIFIFLCAVVYPLWTKGELGSVDWVGTTALILTGLLLTMCGSYFWFVSRRIDPRPEDRLDAEVADGAGEVGFFSPGSYWPLGAALAATLTGLGLVFWMWWLIGLGVLSLLLTASGLLFEYYSGTRRVSEH